MHPDEYAGVSALEGVPLPRARNGESWRIQPSKGTNMGEWLRTRVELFGDGRQLWIDADGVWQFGYRSTATVHDFTSTSGKMQLFAGLGMVRDSDEHFNIFKVEGKEGPDGVPVSYEWIVYRSIQPSGGTGSRKYTGRQKRFPTVRDEAFGSQAECQRACQSLARLHSKPGRYIPGKIFYQPDIFPGDYIKTDGLTVELTQLQGGSISEYSCEDEDFAGALSLMAREVE